MHGEHFKRLTEGLRPVASHRDLLAHVSANFRRIDQASLEVIERSLRQNVFAPLVSGGERDVLAYLATQAGRTDLEDHLHVRLGHARETVVPWLASVTALSGKNVLEIGCGTGSSTVALAEQGALVTALDVDEMGIKVAKDRCKAVGVTAALHLGNASKVREIFPGRRFDMVILYAALEHMTHDERLAAMQGTWELLDRGGHWCVLETPNRLWYFDSHTSLLPFYFWLPDDLAIKYSRFSPRQSFNAAYSGHGDREMLEFLRRGRGVSFHEFDLTLGKVESLKVLTSLTGFLRRQSLTTRLHAWRSEDGRYERLLKRVGPKIHEGFYHRNLDLIIEKC